MKFSHCEDQREDRHLDILTDEEDGLRIIVSRLGAELISRARINEAGEWTGFLYRDNEVSAPSQGWENHAAVMGYYLHRLKTGRSLYRGREIKGGTHGFLRSKIWHFVESTTGESASLRYRITPEDFSPAEYPLRVSLDLSYKMDIDKVDVLFEFRNEEPDLTAHVAFGLHPGFAASSFESFRLQMPPVVIAGISRRAIISLAKPAISIFPAGKCRFQKVSCQDRAFWSLSMCQSVNFAMSIRRADAG
jgi:galactose mutarotase-like enzyme